MTVGETSSRNVDYGLSQPIGGKFAAWSACQQMRLRLRRDLDRRVTKAPPAMPLPSNALGNADGHANPVTPDRHQEL